MTEFQCSKCDVIFNKKFNLNRHVRVKHKSQEWQLFQCDICKKFFTREDNLIKHKISVHEVSSSTSRTRVSTEAFSTAAALSTAAAFSTEAVFSTTAASSTAAASASENREKMTEFQCIKCDVIFNKKFNLNRHVRVTHKSQEWQRLQCDICKKFFTREDNLIKHKISVHDVSSSTSRTRVSTEAFSTAAALSTAAAFSTEAVFSTTAASSTAAASASENKGFSLIQDISLAKCIGVISLGNIHQIEELSHITMLDIQVVKEILQYKEHIQKILKYVPYAKRLLHPDELKNIVALTEILREFLRRLSCQNAKITDEELMLNARLLKSAFCVTGIQIDEKWVYFFRYNFQPSNAIKKPKEEMHKTYFYVRDILTHVQHMLDPEVVVNFNKNFQKNANELILMCSEISGKDINVVRKHTDQEMSGNYIDNDINKNQETITNTTEEESEEEFQKVCIKEEIELGQYYINDNVNEMSNEPNELCKHDNNLVEEIMINDDSNDVIEIYAVIDEDDDDNDAILMDDDEQPETTLITTDENTTKIDEQCCIKQEIENLEYKASEAGFLKNSPELLIEQIKKEPIEIYSSEDIKDEFEKEFAKSQVDQSFSFQEIEHPQNITTEADILKYSQELLIEQMKEEPFEIYSSQDIKDKSEKGFAKSQVEQSSIKHISIQEIKQPTNATVEAGFFKYSQEIFIEQIKEEPIDIKDESEEEFIEAQVEQPSIQHISVDSSMEPEIKEEPSELNYNSFKNNEMSMGREESDVPQAMQQMCPEPIEPVIEPETIQTLNAEVDDDRCQNKEHAIKEHPKVTLTIDDIMHNDIATNLKYGDPLTEERALHIGKILNLKPYGKLNSEILLLDPIICTYIKIEKNCSKLPKLSETALRLAFQLVLGKELYNCQYNYRISPYDFKLYRQLVLLTYSTKYKSSHLMNIDRSDFNETELESILNSSHHILENWRKFFNRHFVSMLYKKAAYEMLFEYRTRYFVISAATTNDTQIKPSDLKILQKTTINDIQLFLCADFTLWPFWQHGYKQFVKNKLETKSYNISKLYNKNDLCLNQIYNDIKKRLPQLVVENLSFAREKGNMELVKSHKPESSTVIDSPKNINVTTNDVTKAQQKHFMLKKVKTDKVYVNRIRSQNFSSKKIENIVEKPILKLPNEILKLNEQLLTDFKPTEHINKKPRIETVMPAAVSNNNLTNVQNMNNDDLESSTEEINTYSSDNKSAETKEVANIKKFQTSGQTSFLGRTLHNDPIITSYRILSKLSDFKKQVPIYSETILRKAFKETFRDNNIEHYSECQPQDLLLYNKLLLLYFSDHTKFMSRIADIMICFDKTSIKEHLANASNIIIEWRIFFEKNLSRLLYKQAIYEILYEYTKRYLRSQKEIPDKALIHAAAKIQHFLRCHIILPAQWLEHFRDLFETRQKSCTNNIDSVQKNYNISDGSSKLNENDLAISTIYEFVNHRINFLVTDTLAAELVSVYFAKVGGKIEFSSFKLNVDIKKQLENDPIIMIYFELSSLSGKKLPIFNGELLHSAFKSVFSHFMKRQYFDYNYNKLYRQLILFIYSEQCSTMAKLAKIMICFSEHTILQCFKEYSTIIQKWREFKKKYLPVTFFQQALHEMLYEYTRRFVHLYGHLTDYHLGRKFDEIKLFFGQQIYMPFNWMRDVGRKFRNELEMTKKDDNIKFTYLDLKLENIYKSIQSQLHSCVIKKREAIVQSRKKQENVLSIESEEVVMDGLKLKVNEIVLNRELDQTEDDIEIYTPELRLCRIQSDYEDNEDEELDNFVMRIQ